MCNFVCVVDVSTNMNCKHHAKKKTAALLCDRVVYSSTLRLSAPDLVYIVVYSSTLRLSAPDAGFEAMEKESPGKFCT